MKQFVSVIIPVYNAFEYLKPCVESVLQIDAGIDFELVLIDDASSDSRIREYLSSINDPRVKIFFNDENLGFTGTCNRGMELTQGDILLLNSDTEVTDGWLRKIYENGYENERIGTVSPLSNNAVVCSVPNNLENNPIPDGYDKDSFNRLIEEASLGNQAVIPSAVGSCMFIKREVIERIGNFDEKTFGKGYGEENDFSMRAFKAGYLNIADDSTFIYHKGNASFLTGSHESKENYRKLCEKHPEYEPMILEAFANKTLQPNLDLIRLMLDAGVYREERKRVLLVKHFEATPGGTGIHVQSLLANMDFDFVVLEHRDDGVVLAFISSGRYQREIFLKKRQSESLDYFVQETIKGVVALFDISLVHFHHILNLHPEILNLPAQLGVRSILTLHDMYLMLNSIKFITHHHQLPQLLKENQSSQMVERFLNRVDLHIFPSEYLKKEFSDYFNLTVESRLVEHGIGFPKREIHTPDLSNGLKIAYVGTATVSKGFDAFAKLIKAFREYQNVQFYVLGAKGEDYQKIVDDYGIVEGKDFVKDFYSGGNPSGVMAKYGIDLAVLPSRLRESYSYVLSEVVNSGVPVLARDIGALSSRVISMGVGELFVEDDDLIDRVRTLTLDSSAIYQYTERVAQTKLPTVEQMCRTYSEIYTTMIAQAEKGDLVPSMQFKWLLVDGISQPLDQFASSKPDSTLKGIVRSTGVIPLVKRLFRALPMPGPLRSFLRACYGKVRSVVK